MKKNRVSGFTLLEVLVTTTIILMMTLAGVVSYVSITQKSRDTRRVSDTEQLRQALEMYRSDKGYYPAVNTSDFGAVSALGATVLVSTYMPSIPKDPKNEATTPYQYVARNGSGTPVRYYGYCICTVLESAANAANNCSGVTPPSGYNNCVSNP
jgi:prepilin-type N-terminal cleavage/methylation domain-containing protein